MFNKFILTVHKCKCVRCDSLTLVEEDKTIKDKVFSCPICEREMEYMHDITVKQLDKSYSDGLDYKRN